MLRRGSAPAERRGERRTLMRLRTVIGPPYLPNRSSKCSAAAEKKGSTIVTASAPSAPCPHRRGSDARSIGGFGLMLIDSWLQYNGMLPRTWTKLVYLGFALRVPPFAGA